MRLLLTATLIPLLFSCGKEKIGLNTGWNALYHIENSDTLSYIYLPNSFTPNGDGRNDVFNLKHQNLDYNDFKFMIFLNNGTTVFSSTDPRIGWDGGIKGVGAAAGLYSWKINARDLSGYQYTANGNVYVVR